MKTRKIVGACLFLGLYLLTSCNSGKGISMDQREISSAWQFQQAGGDLHGDASVPGTIHTDLLNNGLIEDPFYRTNEKDLQWIDKEDWVYTNSIHISAAELKHDHLVLAFEGLDTYADVFLNDEKILEADNMFHRWEADIKPYAKEGENSLEIYFHSPVNEGLRLLDASEYAYPATNDQSENGGLGDKKISVFTRKAGYHYGWDWGPRLVTSGIWRPVKLLMWDELRIKNVFIRQPSVSAELAKLEAEINIEGDSEAEVSVVILNEGEIVTQKDFNVTGGEGSLSLPFEIPDPELWWSNGLGEPHMYDFEFQVLKGGRELASSRVSTGLRSLKLVREKDEAGESFLFELNGIPVFAKGANYIPNDNFLPRVTESDYEKVIADAVNANMNMLRVWGGGIYENETFYELCDKNGIMVWQDFMFACSMYPGNERMLSSIREEARDNVIRLRNHPSIALWCGNNEINGGWSYFSDGGWGWKERYTEEQREEMQKAYMDIFHDILPKVVNKYTDGDDYWPSSPQAGYEVDKHATYESTGGDMHYWGVWHGLHPFESFEKYRARFMSEYGFQSFPDFETVKKYTIPEDYDIESEVMASHQRSGIGNLRIKEYMEWDYQVPGDFEQFLYMSQVLQARGIKMAIEAHRRAMPYCMGTLYWQINDCWPVASWSSTDYYHKWKAVHYAAKDAYEPVIVSAFVNDGVLEVYGVSDLLEPLRGELKLSILDFSGNELSSKSMASVFEANTSTLLEIIPLDDLTAGIDKQSSLLKIDFVSGDEYAGNLFYFVKPENQNLPEVDLQYKLKEEEGHWLLTISSEMLARNVYISFENQDVFCSDNYFDLLPGQEKEIILTGGDTPSADAIRMMHLELCQN